MRSLPILETGFTDKDAFRFGRIARDGHTIKKTHGRPLLRGCTKADAGRRPLAENRGG